MMLKILDFLEIGIYHGLGTRVSFAFTGKLDTIDDGCVCFHPIRLLLQKNDVLRINYDWIFRSSFDDPISVSLARISIATCHIERTAKKMQSQKEKTIDWSQTIANENLIIFCILIHR